MESEGSCDESPSFRPDGIALMTARFEKKEFKRMFLSPEIQ